MSAFGRQRHLSRSARLTVVAGAAIAALSSLTIGSTSALAAKPKKKPAAEAGKPSAPPAAEAAPAPAKGPAPSPAAGKPLPAQPKPAVPEPKTVPAEPKAAPAEPKTAPGKSEPAATPGEPFPVPAKPPEIKEPTGVDKPAGPTDSLWEGFFFNFGFGYASSGGQPGPQIPAVKGTLEFQGKTYTGALKLQDHTFLDYNALVTTDVGSGMAAMLQFGYNIAGYVSIWLDIAAHGNLSADKKNMAGGGGVAFIGGIHPLRFVRGDLPVDLKIYAGYVPLEVLAYNENEIQPEYKAKAWLGPAVPFGLHTEWKPKPKGGFALGLDLRMVRASYNQWYFNWDKEQYSSPGTDGTSIVTTLRFEPRLTLAAHF